MGLEEPCYESKVPWFGTWEMGPWGEDWPKKESACTKQYCSECARLRLFLLAASQGLQCMFLGSRCFLQPSFITVLRFILFLNSLGFYTAGLGLTLKAVPAYSLFWPQLSVPCVWTWNWGQSRRRQFQTHAQNIGMEAPSSPTHVNREASRYQCPCKLCSYPRGSQPKNKAAVNGKMERQTLSP